VFPNGLAGIDGAALKRRVIGLAQKLMPKRGAASTTTPTPTEAAHER
jgi:hypothetical protein